MGFVRVVNRIQLNIKLLGNPGGRRGSGASEEVQVGVGGGGGGRRGHKMCPSARVVWIFY